MLKLASDGIISFSTKPLKLVGALGIISIIISVILLIYALVSYACKLNNLSAGWTSIMVAITFSQEFNCYQYGLYLNMLEEYMTKQSKGLSI